jgi:hypothetical protein
MPDVDLPQIVAKQSWLAQSAALAATTIFTPTADGLFRVSAYIEVSVGSNRGPSAQMTWTDDHAAQNNSGLIGGVDTAGNWTINGNYATRAFRATNGNPIKIATTINAGSGTYDLYVVIEQLW